LGKLSEPFTRGQAWVDLILLANHSDGYFRTNGQRVYVSRGQVGYSLRSLAARWKWSDGKVKRFIDELEADGKIKAQTSNVTTIISILNYSHYQNIEAPKMYSRSTGESRTMTNNKDNKNNNENNKRGFSPPPLIDISDYFLEIGSSNEEAEKFMDYYNSNGWKIGKNPMKDWKASARNWMKRSDNFNHLKQNKNATNKYRNPKPSYTNQTNELTRTEQAKVNLIASLAQGDSRKFGEELPNDNGLI
jgi:DNA-binding transcriptional MocR family regulator